MASLITNEEYDLMCSHMNLEEHGALFILLGGFMLLFELRVYNLMTCHWLKWAFSTMMEKTHYLIRPRKCDSSFTPDMFFLWLFCRVQLHRHECLYIREKDSDVPSHRRGFSFCLCQEEQTRGPTLSQYYRCKPSCYY